MRSHRITILIAGILAASIAATPAAAHTSTLLSGYGGPGQGNQAILGSTVVKGGGGSQGGGGGAAASGQAEASAGSGEERGSEPSLVATEAPSGAGHAPSGSASSAGHPATGEHPRATRRAGATAATPHAARATVAQATAYPASERLGSGQHDSALGLSSADLVYVLLAAAVLVSLGVLTRRAGYADGRQSADG
jgi:hypothetical protein